MGNVEEIKLVRTNIYESFTKVTTKILSWLRFFSHLMHYNTNLHSDMVFLWWNILCLIQRKFVCIIHKCNVTHDRIHITLKSNHSSKIITGLFCDVEVLSTSADMIDTCFPENCHAGVFASSFLDTGTEFTWNKKFSNTNQLSKKSTILLLTSPKLSDCFTWTYAFTPLEHVKTKSVTSSS